MFENELQVLFEKLPKIHITERRAVRAEILSLTQKLNSLDLLVPYLSSDNYLVREYAAEAMGLVNNEHSVRYLTQLLAKEDNNQVQMAILYSLRDLKIFSALESLIKIAENTAYSNLVRSLAMQSIATATLNNVIAPMFDVLDEAALVPNWTGTDIVESAFETFEGLDVDENAVPQRLVRMLRSDKIPNWLRLQAIIYLGKRRYAGAVDEIVRFLDSDDADLRNAAVNALGDLGIPKVIGKLEAISSDPNETVQRSIKQALTRLKNLE